MQLFYEILTHVAKRHLKSPLLFSLRYPVDWYFFLRRLLILPDYKRMPVNDKIYVFFATFPLQFNSAFISPET